MIGIITLYHNNINYGGNLQAYALVAHLQKQGYEAQQILFSHKSKSPSANRKLNFAYVAKHPMLCVKGYYGRFLKKLENKRYHVTERRKKAFSDFAENVIPHGEKVYDATSIRGCVADYNAFITGSDQVWNFTWYNSEFFLDFVPSDKIKMSYAASIAMDGLTDAQKEIFQNSLKDYRAVSVREKSAIPLLEGLSPVAVESVLDPTLLLDKSDWEKICSDRIIDEEYLFCYFLGENTKARRLAERFAKQNHLKLVNIPHASGWVKLEDRKFGDVKLFDATPNDFISLIKHAKYVFTDSFHAVVFSHIYQKQYVIFNRNKSGEMSSRIQDITELFGSQSRFCYDASRENLQYIKSLEDIDYSRPTPDFERIKCQSVEYLERNLGDIKI